ncbi:Fur family transcriptional regulator [Gynuella sp.]|uniref:Fur family transcriptional regulator n=1 Tax=Gynuella sp. TaxID=2969146 RepID=UPI003D0C41ED
MSNSASTTHISAHTSVVQKLLDHDVLPTPQRRIIAETLFAKPQHCTAEQLHDQIKASGYKVSKATIYNTLGLFAQKGLVRMIYADTATTFYDSNTSAHHHFFNTDNGEISDIHENLIHSYLQDCLPAGTRLDSVDLVVRIRNKF